MMLTVIIPTLNAQNGLGSLLNQLGKVDDLIISDGGSTDETLSLALSTGAHIIMGCKGRGWQLARGGRWACERHEPHDWILFLHADCELSDHWRAAVEKHIKHHPKDAGYFRFAFADMGMWPRIMEFFVGWRCRLAHLPYGDQGLLIRADHYLECGGYPNTVLFEDVAIVRALRNLAKMRGGRGVRPMAAKIYTDAQRYKADGYLRRSVKNWHLLRRYLTGADPDTLVKTYEHQREKT
ncbi:MAG TPA: glycosyltransferase [Hellea balneolensis]|uniref:Glycosyltransferase n=1 Tax=Hellea balneolensis TaxID=287478 RepID=A0A7C3C910_9PROT|nr:glycosyltransferase [Hellea balneolensis]